jgi:hypothetical protein
MKNLWFSSMLLAPAIANMGCSGDLYVAKDVSPDGGSASNGDAGSSTSRPLDASTSSVDGGGGGSAGVSFAAEVMPIFQRTCTVSSECHGQVGNAQEENLYLGNGAGGTPSSQIHDLLVGVPSKEDPSMNLVTARDPSNRYLWLKVSGDPNSNPLVVSGCAKATSLCNTCETSQPCGYRQPYLASPLPTGELDAIQNWIVQGAQNN